mgnify:CR=1 FL=1
MDISTAKANYPGAETFKFGDSEALSESLLSLVKSGKKTATCGALSEYGEGGDVMSEVGRIDIALNWDGTPAVALRMLSVVVTKFCDVDESFALAEGEDDDLEGWRRGHQGYFERNGGFDPEMSLVCERFEVVEMF